MSQSKFTKTFEYLRFDGRLNGIRCGAERISLRLHGTYSQFLLPYARKSVFAAFFLPSVNSSYFKSLDAFFYTFRPNKPDKYVIKF